MGLFSMRALVYTLPHLHFYTDTYVEREREGDKKEEEREEEGKRELGKFNPKL